MLVHIALFKWKESASKVEIDEALSEIRQLRKKVPGLIDIRCGLNSHAESKGFTHAVLVLAENQQALNAYRTHPDHDAAAKILLASEEDGIGCDFQDFEL